MVESRTDRPNSLVQSAEQRSMGTHLHSRLEVPKKPSSRCMRACGIRVIAELMARLSHCLGADPRSPSSLLFHHLPLVDADFQYQQ